MIKRLKCLFMGHQESFDPYWHKIINGEMKVVIPTTTHCLCCYKQMVRKLHQVELHRLITVQEILDDQR